MRKLLYLSLLVLLAPLSARANQAVRGWCEVGAQPVVTSGFNSTTKVQQSFPQCSVTVFIHGGGTAMIFSDNSGTVLANPFTAQTNGQWQFYVANGHYDVLLTFTGPNPPTPVTYSDVLVSDPANQQAAIPNTLLAFSATPDFPSTNNASYTLTLIGNVTSSTASGTPANGNLLSLTLIEDATGGRTMVFPTSFILPLGFSFNTLANATNALTWKFDGTNWNLISNTGSGGGSNPSPPVNSLQKNNGAGALGSSSITDDGTNVTVGENSRFKGPNPYIDITAYGARTCNVNQAPCVSGITATCTSGQPTVTLSSASTFRNGDGVIVYGCGPAHSMATPAAPTVTPSLARVMTGTRDVVNGPTGTTTYNYCVAWRDLLGGMTPCSPTGTTTTGAASLGSTSVALTSLSRSNDIVSAVTSSAHGLPVGCTGQQSGATACPMVYIQTTTPAFADNSWLGWFRVLTVADTTHFTYQGSQDTRNGALAAVSAGFTGNVFYYQSNHASFGAAPTGGFQPYIYAAGGALIGPSWATNPSIPALTDTQFDDFGGTMMGTANIAAPGYVPTTAPASATNDALVTTIVSGAGTTTLILAANAGNTISGQTILLDNAPNIKAAVTANYNGVSGPPIYFPQDPAGNVYVTNSLLDLRTNSPTLVINNTVQFNDSVLLGSGSVEGRMLPGKGSVGAFSFGSYSQVFCRTNPCLYATANNSSGYMNWLSIAPSSNGGNQAVLVMQDGGAAKGPPNYTNMDINVTGQTSISFLGRGNTSGTSFSVQGDRLNILGNQFTDGATATPIFLATTSVGTIKFGSIFLSGQGMMNSGGGQLQNDWLYCQGCRTPLWTVSFNQLSNTGLQAKFGAVTHDTTAQPLLVYLPGQGSLDAFVEVFTDNGPSSNGPMFSGSRLRLIQNFSGMGALQGQNRDFNVVNAGLGLDGLFAINGSPNYTVQRFGVGTSLSQAYPLFTEAAPMVAPAVAVAAGGSVAVGSHTYQILPVWFNGGTGPNSLTSSPCVTTSGNQTCNLTWTPTTGCKGYNIVRDGILESGTVPQVSGCGSSSFSDTLASSFGGNPNVTTGGPSMMMPGTQGIAAPSVIIGGANGSSTQTTSATVSRSITWPDAGGTPAFINNPQTWTSPQSFSNGTTLRFFGPNGTNWTALTGPGSNPASNVTFQLPSADSSGVQCISSNGSGVLAFSNCSGGTGTPGGALTQVQFFAAGPTFGGSPNLTYVSPALTIGVNAAATGQVILANGGASGASVTVQNNAATTAYNFNLPTGAGTAGFPLLSQGGGASPMTFSTLGAGAGGTGLTSWGTNQLIFSTGGTGVLANLSSSTITNTAGGTQLKIQPTGAAGVALALDTAASPTGDIEDLNIFGTKSAWFDSSAFLHVPQMTTTGSGPAVVSGPEGNCPAAVNGSDILCLGDSTAHTGKLSNNGVAPKSIAVWFNDNPNFHGVATVGAQFPQLNFTSPGTSGQAFISGGPSVDGAYGTLNPVGGGTGLTTITAHGVMLGEGTSSVATTGPDATANQPLISVSATADPVFGPLPLGDANAVSGTLPIAHGGTGSTTLAGANIVTVSGSFTTGNCVKSSASTVTIDAGGPCAVTNAATQFSVPYYSAAGSASTLSGLTAPTTPNTVPQFLVSTPSGGVATAPTFNFFAVPVNAQTGTTYTVAATDRFSFLTQNNAAAIATTLPQAGTTNFTQNFSFLTKTTGAGANTITPTTSTINGAATLLVPQFWTAMVFSDNTNYFATRVPDYAGFPNCGDATHGLGFSTSTGVFNCQAITGSAAAGGSNTQLQYNNATALGGITQWTTNGTTTVTESATGVLDLSAGAPTAALKLPTSAGAAPTADSFLGFDSTGHGVVFGSNGSTAGVVFNTANFTSGDLIQANGNHVSIDSGIAAANVPTAASSAAAAKQIAVSGGANKALNFIDMPETFYVPAANCVNATAASAWSTGATPAALCRAGTNNKDGLLSPWGASDVGYFKVHLPNDWDSGASLDISIDLTSTDTTNAHTIIMQASTVCGKGDGSTTDDVAFNTAQSFGTITLNGNANRTWNATLTGLTKTGCAAGSTLWIKISRTTDTATNVGVYGATVDVARLLTVQAN